MSNVSAIARSARFVFGAMLLIAFVVLTGCGNSGGFASTPPPVVVDPPPTPPSTIEGVATPTAVAVVTATNAQ